MEWLGGRAAALERAGQAREGFQQLQKVYTSIRRAETDVAEAWMPVFAEFYRNHVRAVAEDFNVWHHDTGYALVTEDALISVTDVEGQVHRVPVPRLRLDYEPTQDQVGLPPTRLAQMVHRYLRAKTGEIPDFYYSPLPLLEAEHSGHFASVFRFERPWLFLATEDLYTFDLEPPTLRHDLTHYGRFRQVLKWAEHGRSPFYFKSALLSVGHDLRFHATRDGAIVDEGRAHRDTLRAEARNLRRLAADAATPEVVLKQKFAEHRDHLQMALNVNGYMIEHLDNFDAWIAEDNPDLRVEVAPDWRELPMIRLVYRGLGGEVPENLVLPLNRRHGDANAFYVRIDAEHGTAAAEIPTNLRNQLMRGITAERDQLKEIQAEMSARWDGEEFRSWAARFDTSP